MSTTQLYGKAQIKYGTSFSTTFNLAVPLQKVRPAEFKFRKARTSLSGTTRTVTTVGSGAYEIVGRIRYDDDPANLLAMLRAGMDGGTLRYVPDSDVPATYNDCQLMEPTALPEIGQEVDAPAILEFAIEIRLRREDGAAFQGVF